MFIFILCGDVEQNPNQQLYCAACKIVLHRHREAVQCNSSNEWLQRARINILKAAIQDTNISTILSLSSSSETQSSAMTVLLTKEEVYVSSPTYQSPTPQQRTMKVFINFTKPDWPNFSNFTLLDLRKHGKLLSVGMYNSLCVM